MNSIQNVDIIQKICGKYQIEYMLKPEFGTRSVALSFGSQVPKELQDCVQDGMTRQGVYMESTGMPVCLDVLQGVQEGYVLKVSGEEMFYFRTSDAPIPFDENDLVEAVSWTIYILAAGKNWLDSYREKNLFCKCFSARQQAAAVRLGASVKWHREGEISQERIQDIFDELRGSIGKLASQAPRFSAQPIAKSAFDQWKGCFFKKPQLKGSRQEIAQDLFGGNDFAEEQDSFCQMMGSRSEYRSKLEAAVNRLVEISDSLPLVSISRMFTELGTLIDELKPTDCSGSLAQKPVSITLSPENLKNCFKEADNAFLSATKTRLEAEFLRKVCEQAKARIEGEVQESLRTIANLDIALNRFCFVSSESFAQSGADLLGWRQLKDLQDRDIYSRDISWTLQSLNELQGELNSKHAPQVWICSEKLKNQSENSDITAGHLTKAAPLMDERFVWGIWAYDYDGGGESECRKP